MARKISDDLKSIRVSHVFEPPAAVEYKCSAPFLFLIRKQKDGPKAVSLGVVILDLS